MRVLACVKRVPAPGAKISITDDAQAVDSTHLGFAVSPHEECGVEGAVQLVEQFGGESVVLTLGAPEAEEQLRYAASVGVNKAVLRWPPTARPGTRNGPLEQSRQQSKPWKRPTDHST
ncbi:MAG: hypothetical protein R2706_02725 [Acidimicrobiales bacterium]